MGRTNFDIIRAERGAEQVRVAITAPTDPAPGAGDIYFDTATGRMYVYNGTSWKYKVMTTTSTSTTSSSTSTTSTSSSSTSTTSSSTSSTSSSSSSSSTSTT